jgi:nucleotide-binding universal stress UspA family protein
MISGLPSASKLIFTTNGKWTLILAIIADLKRGGDSSMFKKILFCTDFSENSDHAFSYAFNLARAYDATLLILHVIVEPVCYYWSTPKGVDELIAKQTERVKQEINTHYLQKIEGFKNYEIFTRETDEGRAFYEIIQVAREESADLIVMGTHGRTGIDHLILGSTAENVVRKSPSPVLTVRLPGKKFIMP